MGGLVDDPMIERGGNVKQHAEVRGIKEVNHVSGDALLNEGHRKRALERKERKRRNKGNGKLKFSQHNLLGALFPALLASLLDKARLRNYG